VKLLPAIVTIVPAGPLAGRKLEIETLQEVAAVIKKSSIPNPSSELVAI